MLDVKLGVPKEMGGAGGEVTNPEQLFAAGYSACFLGAMKFVANRDKITMPKDAFIEGEVGIGPLPTGFGIEAKLNIHLPGMGRRRGEKTGRCGRTLSARTPTPPATTLMLTLNIIS
ncbi:General stress protein 17o [Leclercia adecarboxylata]|uniref:General stress protein 17o n=1 Tax=Leclercia adecarboxylata TaxID=83655 RepID=A0A4U9HML6_9ENTR|nr:General stress protein 17o [Leclercia adecarboxylata]